MRSESELKDILRNKENELQELLQEGITNFIDGMLETELYAEIRLLKYILEMEER